MKLTTLTAYLERTFDIETRAGDLVIYQKEDHKNKRVRICIIHRHGEEILWTLEYSDINGMMSSDQAPNVETAIMKFLAGHLEREVIRAQNGIFYAMMENFIVEPSEEDLSPGVPPQRFVTTHRSGTEIRYAIFEAGRPDPLAIFDCEEEANKSPLLL